MSARRGADPRGGAIGESGRKRARGAAEATQEAGVIEEIAAEFSTEELLEFLEADVLPIEADPEFRERLRSELWTLLQSLPKK
jgi:hypothetical protein